MISGGSIFPGKSPTIHCCGEEVGGLSVSSRKRVKGVSGSLKDSAWGLLLGLLFLYTSICDKNDIYYRCISNVVQQNY